MTRSRKIPQGACIASPDLDPRPIIFAWSSAPLQPNARRVGADQGCGPAGNHCDVAIESAQPSNLGFCGRLGKTSRSDVIMHENAAGRGCVAASSSSPWDFLRRPMMANGGVWTYLENATAGRKPLSGRPSMMRKLATTPCTISASAFIFLTTSASIFLAHPRCTLRALSPSRQEAIDR